MQTGVRVYRSGAIGLAAGAALAAILVAATTVWACTITMGLLTLTPSSGAAGTVISTSATGMKPRPAKYAMHFTTGLISAGADCMSYEGNIFLKTIPTTRQGGWTNVPVTVPANASLGTHGLCGLEAYPTKGQTGTTHETFTVT